MKTIILLAAILLPAMLSAQVFDEEFCEANPNNGICIGFAADRARLTANEAQLEDHEARIIANELQLDDHEARLLAIEFFVHPMAHLEGEDSVSTDFIGFVEANGTDDTLSNFIVNIEQPDGTLAAISISASKGGHWGTGSLYYADMDCTGTAYFSAAWTFREVGGVQGAITINAQAGFDGVPYTFSIGPVSTVTVKSKVVPGHPVTAPVCTNFSPSPISQANLRPAIPVQNIPVIIAPSTATIELLP